MQSLRPASRYQEMAAELVSSMVWRVFCGHHEDADTEEQEDPPNECEPYWYETPTALQPPPRLASGKPQDVARLLSRNRKCRSVAPLILTTALAVSMGQIRWDGCSPVRRSSLGDRSVFEGEQDPERDIVIAPDPIKDKPLRHQRDRQSIYAPAMRWWNLAISTTEPPQILFQAGISIDQPVTLRLEDVMLTDGRREACCVKRWQSERHRRPSASES